MASLDKVTSITIKVQDVFRGANKKYVPDHSFSHSLVLHQQQQEYYKSTNSASTRWQFLCKRQFISRSSCTFWIITATLLLLSPHPWPCLPNKWDPLKKSVKIIPHWILIFVGQKQQSIDHLNGNCRIYSFIRITWLQIRLSLPSPQWRQVIKYKLVHNELRAISRV